MTSELFIAEETVRVHIHKLIKKLLVGSRKDVPEWVSGFNRLVQ